MPFHPTHTQRFLDAQEFLRNAGPVGEKLAAELQASKTLGNPVRPSRALTPVEAALFFAALAYANRDNEYFGPAGISGVIEALQQPLGDK